MKQTGEITSEQGLFGDKLYQVRAREALPILVRQAKAGQPITYADLAEELGMPNPRNLNYVLGAIGNAILELSKVWKMEVPPIQALVINKATQLPGEGISWFVPDAALFTAASPSRKHEMIKLMLIKVYSFQDWDNVLHHFGLQPFATIDVTPNPLHPVYDSTQGESLAHRSLKEFVAHHPQEIGLPSSCAPGQIEYVFRSADAVDILFRHQDEWIGVEVKSALSDTDDIARGLFQCIKYRALLEATQMVEQLPISCRSILVLEAVLPKELIALRNTLGVEVVQGVTQK